MKTSFIITFLFWTIFLYPHVSRGERLKVTFYPEGGVLVKGIKSMVAFKVTDETGENLHVFGVVKDTSGNRVVMFASYDGGAGVFEITPQDGPYQAEINYAGKSYSVALPEIRQEGYGLDVDIISQVDDGTKYGRVHTPEQLERLKRLRSTFGQGAFSSVCDDINYTMTSQPLRSAEWWIISGMIRADCDFFQGKYIPEYEESWQQGQIILPIATKFSVDDVKLRISRSSNMPMENVIVSAWKDNKELDLQSARMQKKEVCVRFLLQNLPEGLLEFRLSNCQGKKLASRWVCVNHYAQGRNYREAKKQDIEMMMFGQIQVGAVNAHPVTYDEERVNISFYPEGGTLLRDAKSWIAFRAEDVNGKPVDVYGVVRNEKGYPVTFFESYENGLGLFSLLPDGGQYTAEVNCRGQSSCFELSVAPEEGFTLEVDYISHAEDGIYGQIYTAEQKERIFRLTKWRGDISFILEDTPRDSLPTVGALINMLKPGLDSVDCMDIMKILVRGRQVGGSDSLTVAVVCEGNTIASRKVKGGKQFISRTFFPFADLSVGEMKVTLSDSWGKLLASRRICINPADSNSYRRAKFHDLQIMTQP